MTTTAELLLAADRARPRSKQIELGFSGVGGCRRRAAYALALTPHSNQSGSVVAALGTAAHDFLARAMVDLAEPGDLVEHRVEYAGIYGTLDRFEAKTKTVVEVKTTSPRSMESYQLHGPPRAHKWQASLCAAGLIKQGHEVERIRLEYLDRAYGEEWTYEQPLDPQDVVDALEWLDSVKNAEVEMTPREANPDGPYCGSCAYFTVCWEQNAIPGRDLRTVFYVDNPDAGYWAEELWISRKIEKEAKEDSTKARGALTAVVDPGGVVTQCGDRFLRLDGRGRMTFVPPAKVGKR